MIPKASDEKAKPFRLVKYFSFISLSVIFIATIVIVVFHTYWVKSMLLKKSEAYASLLVENLNHQIFLQFVIPVALKYGNIQLRNKSQFKRLDKVVRSTFNSFNIEMVNIYDTNNVISYSFDKKRVGKKNIGGTGFYNASKGIPTSSLIQKGDLLAILLGFPKESKLITYAPLRAEKPLSRISGPVLGIVEIIQDLSNDHITIFKLQFFIIQTCTIVMGILFIILRLVVKRGENIIQSRTQERIKLKEELARANHLSTIGGMTAAISHEIRNPLGIIKSSAELLKKKMLKLDATNTIPDIIVEESVRLNNIIADFLDYAKPKQPHLILTNIIDVIEKNLTFLEPQLENKNYTLKRYYAKNLPHIMLDQDMLYQAFLNILINSIQAMPEGGKILVAVGSSEKSIIILFSDSGCGIPSETLDKIWDPFYTTKSKGTGLGIGVVKNVIESHKGTIRIENRPVRGVQVTIELPIQTSF